MKLLRWHRAFDEDLPKSGQAVIYWFEYVGYHIGIYKRNKWPKGAISIEGGELMHSFQSAGGILNDEDVYWTLLPNNKFIYALYMFILNLGLDSRPDNAYIIKN